MDRIEIEIIDNSSPNVLTNDQVIALLSIYNDEWCYRDDSVWKHTFKYFFATIIMMMMPNIAGYFNLNLNLPAIIFRLIGLAIAIFSFYVGIAYAIRLEASGDTYRRILSYLPAEYRRTSINAIKKKKFFVIFKPSLAYVIPTIFFIANVLLFLFLVFVVQYTC